MKTVVIFLKAARFAERKTIESIPHRIRAKMTTDGLKTDNYQLNLR